ncbi:hypothetical protein HOT47_gp79 [Microbacterium phage Quhwah]|uniref:Uncharacterized protein n=1 Tax=Microbacterium phage Quhwah TaxID=2992929 RepID=A0A2Z4Q9W3_9CAUD|nr:hypothetical protein HOT47_gp79 [Microbacterium phage Quhwah]AWY06786.1 hypothetical protein SEA_QUHWAH_78 [Microbacterium phage Quhwah]
MTRWRGIVAVEGVATEDGRLIEPTAMQWDIDRGIPLVLPSTVAEPYVLVGVIDHLERRERHPHGALIYAEGSLVSDRLPDRLDLSATVISGERDVAGWLPDLDGSAEGSVSNTGLDYPLALVRCDLRQVVVGAEKVWDECVLEVIEDGAQ